MLCLMVEDPKTMTQALSGKDADNWRKAIQAELESKYAGKRIFMTFYMPMIVLAIRMEIEVIFKNSYPEFFSEDT